ncbi:MAG: pyruvate formate lyase family protein, partial [Clostridiales bacterium]|nr:pyruvate formate lyase family protein [Clostridiales bacterium]
MTELIEIEPFGAGYHAAAGHPHNVRMAAALKAVAEHSPICFLKGEYLPCSSPTVPGSGAYYTFGSGLAIDAGRFGENAKEHPELSDILLEILEELRPYNTGEQVGICRDRYQAELSSTGACWGGGWAGHSNPDYDRLLSLGTEGIRELIAKYRRINPEEADFYDGCDIVLDAVDILGERFLALAEKSESETSDPGEKRIYAELTSAFRQIPRRPARNMCEAICLFWMIFTFDGIDSPGRLDQFFLPAWEATERENAMLWLDRLWQAFHRTRTWNLCISG